MIFCCRGLSPQCKYISCIFFFLIFWGTGVFVAQTVKDYVDISLCDIVDVLLIINFKDVLIICIISDHIYWFFMDKKECINAKEISIVEQAVHCLLTLKILPTVY